MGEDPLLKHLYVDVPDDYMPIIVKIQDTYIRITYRHEEKYEVIIEETEPKTKTVTYFD